MAPSSIEQDRKKRKMDVDCDVGESSDVSDSSGESCALDLLVPDFLSKDLSKCWKVDDLVGKGSDGSFAFSVSGFPSLESAQHFQQMVQQLLRDFPTKTADGSQLQEDVLVRIAENHLFHADDFAMFSSVSRSWHRSAAACNLLKLRQNWSHSQMPWLMLTDANTDIDIYGYSKSTYVLPQVLNDIEDVKFPLEVTSGPGKLYARSVSDLRRGKSYDIECPEGYGRVCWGSAHGWIVTAGGDGKMFMFNPLTKSRVGLPSFGTFRWRWDNEDQIRRNYFVTKAVLLRVRDNDDAQTWDDVENFRVVAFYGDDHVAIVKPGNRRWVEIEGGARSISHLMDVVYDSSIGLIFVDDCGGLLSCSLPEKDDESPLLEWIQPPDPSMHEVTEVEYHVGVYIIKCDAGLLMVRRTAEYIGDQDQSTIDLYGSMGFTSDTYMTVCFEVHKFDFRAKSWVEYDDLKDLALFVGNNASMWVDARSEGCERNSIYYTDDLRFSYRRGKNNLGGHDSGVRKLSSPRGVMPWSQPLPVPKGSNTLSPYCCPFWFRPSVAIPRNFQ